jgi:heme/copper-type cytochrome/quinol oxidase subunit 2
MDESTGETTRSTRSVAFTVLGAVVVLLVTVAYTWYVTYKPAYGADRTANSAVAIRTVNGIKQATLRLAIQQEVGLGKNADWLGYQTETSTPHPGTVFNLPKNTLVTVVIHNYDSRTALRNTFFTLVQGTVGNSEVVDGKRIRVMNPDLTSHTFTIPDFGVSVPLEGISDSAKPNSFTTMQFNFRTPNRTGVFRWQCIVPCGSGLYGNGGPMAGIGYMQGIITLS